MSQTPLGRNTINAAGALVPNQTDGNGNLMTSSGGLTSALNVTAAEPINAAPGRLNKIVVITAPSAGNLQLNDCTTVGAATAANTILKIAFGSLTAGQVINLDWPCLVGITVASVGTGGVFALSYSV